MTTPNPPHDSLKSLLKPLHIRGSEVFVHGVMRRVRQIEQPVTLWGWAWSRWAMPTLAVSAVGFALTLGFTLQPDTVSADTLLSATTPETNALATELEEWWLGVEGVRP